MADKIELHLSHSLDRSCYLVTAVVTRSRARWTALADSGLLSVLSKPWCPFGTSTMSIVKELTPAQAKNLVTPSAIAGPSRPAREDTREGYRRANASTGSNPLGSSR